MNQQERDVLGIQGRIAIMEGEVQESGNDITPSMSSDITSYNETATGLGIVSHTRDNKKVSKVRTLKKKKVSYSKQSNPENRTTSG